MIEREVYEDALNATEEFLLVPVPVGSTKIEDGFAKQVLSTYPFAAMRFKNRAGMDEGETLMVGTMAGEKKWLPLYTIVFAAIHHHAKEGWKRSPELLNKSLDNVYERFGNARLATAGIPGNGLSGIKGDAPIIQIENVLDQSPLRVFVYKRGYSGDREKLSYVEPPLESQVGLDLPIDASPIKA